MKSKYIISIIMALTTGAAFATVTINATDRTNLASKAYVDVTRQAKASFNQAENAGLPVEINGVQNDYREQTDFVSRSVYDGSDDYYESKDEFSLVVAGVVADFAAAVENTTIPDTTLVCANSPECSLWIKPTPAV